MGCKNWTNNHAKTIMAEKNPKLQEDVETGGFSTEEEELATFVYMLEGKVFTITKESPEALETLWSQLEGALPDTDDGTMSMARIVDQVQTVMAINYGDIKGSKKLKDKVKNLRANLRKRITDLNDRIEPIIGLREVTEEDELTMIIALK